MEPRRSGAGRVSLVYFVSTLSAGGAQVGMVRLLEGLDPDRYDVTVVSVLSKENDVRAAIPKQVSVRDLESVPAWRKPVVLSRVVAQADVLVCSLYHATLVGRILGAVHRTPVVLNWQHSERFANRIREGAIAATNRFSDRILADSPAVKTALVTDYGLDPDHVRTVPIAGVDTDEFSPAWRENTPPVANGAGTSADVTETGATRGPSGVTASADSDGPLRVATIGSLIPPKKQIRVLETARELESRSEAPRVTFSIAGTGELDDALRTKRDEWEIETVDFAGFVSDVPSFLRQQDVYLHTSAYEGLCIAALEAMACGLPVVSTRVGGLASYVEDGASGYLIDEPTPEVIADTILRLSDPERRRAFGRRGRAIVEESYSRERLVSAFENVVEECLRASADNRVDGSSPAH